MQQLLLFTLSLLPWMPASNCEVTLHGEYSALEGRSLTIPCHYQPQYARNVKYWCQGKTREFCTSLARTDGARSINPAVEKVSIFDDPVQQVSTVTMNHLKEGDSGWYMCGVEIGSMWKADDVAYTYIKVIHGLSAVKTQVSGEEGSSVTVKCLYSERLRDSEKTWCRSGDPGSCRSTGSEGSYEDSSVAIRDDRIGAFTVTFKKLQTGDTAWYWCSAGQEKASVQILVTPRPTTTATSKSTPPMTKVPQPHADSKDSKETRNGHNHLLAIMVVCLCIIILGVVVMAARKLWNYYRKDSVLREVAKMKAKYNGYSVDVDDLQSVAVVFLNKNSEEVHS
ncbi:Polymeric immunoglobulin receptor [Oryzias melastigma]|uniref:Polymeric immunoglobulin receptor n=1 Tax=Oryzias melastigma TaxID=30732 RepID=A0A3B3DIE6_ORYME|nr:polymeric immunoglobulin receptor [Oryzias melastigma]KAF6718443.1 Polymeric immunoglobulin receptor [Oryzias melastigma]